MTGTSVQIGGVHFGGITDIARRGFDAREQGSSALEAREGALEHEKDVQREGKSGMSNTKGSFLRFFRRSGQQKRKAEERASSNRVAEAPAEFLPIPCPSEPCEIDEPVISPRPEASGEEESRSLRERLKAAETRRGPSPVSPMFAFEQFVVESLTRKQRRPQFDLAATVEAIRKEGSPANGGAATGDRAQAAPAQGLERFREGCEAANEASGQGLGFSGERNESPQISGEGIGGSQALHREGFKVQGRGGNVHGLEGSRDGELEERSGGLAELKLEATLGSGTLRNRESSGCCGLPKTRNSGLSAGSDGERKGSAGQNVRREHAMQHNPLYEQGTPVSSCEDSACEAKESHERITSGEGAGSSSQQKPFGEVDAISRDGNTVPVGVGGVDGRKMGELSRLDVAPSRNSRGEIKWSKTEEELQQALLHLQENLAASEQCQRSSTDEANGSAFRIDHREGAHLQPAGFGDSGKPDRQSPGAVNNSLDGG